MTIPIETQEYASTAYRSDQAVELPETRAKRERVGDELQPYGAYANLNPYDRTVEDIDTVQYGEREDPEFYKENWWWDHQRLRFRNGEMPLKFLILVPPSTWTFPRLTGGSFAVGCVFVSELREGLPPVIFVALLLASWAGWSSSALRSTP